MSLEWFKPRRYRHFDLPVNEAFAQKAMAAAFVAKHPFSPLIHYDKSETRYKKDPLTGNRTITTKDRPIKYASHRDACILSYYAQKLNLLLNQHYDCSGIGDSAIAYRALGLTNYDFAAEAFSYANANSPVAILAFDVTGFFDTLDHGILKIRLKQLLNVTEMPNDWYKIFRFITNFYYVELSELKDHPFFGARLKEKTLDPIATVAELKTEKIAFRPNPEIAKGNRRGIPQGTPISAAMSNLYMMEFDKEARAACDKIGALYKRYSDDILVICKSNEAAEMEAEIMRLIAAEKLEIAPHKTEKTLFCHGSGVPRTSKAAQYLGFTLDEAGAAIRESSLARQWRKMRRAIRRARKSHAWRVKAGLAPKVHTKKLYRRFSYIKVSDGDSVRILRNFSSYGRRSAASFGPSEKVSGQVKRFEKAALRAIAELKKL